MIIIIIITTIIPYCDNQNSTRGEIVDILLIAVTLHMSQQATWLSGYRYFLTRLMI